MKSDPVFADLLAAARAGENSAVTELYRDLHPVLARYLRAHEPRAADDLEAEVWLAFAERVHAFEGDELALRAWMLSIARRRLADYRRTAARRRTDPVTSETLDRPDSDEDPATIVLEGLAGDEAAAFIVRSLPRDQAEVVLLRVIGGLDAAQVGELMGKKPGTIRVLSHRAMRTLERKLSGKRVTQ